MAAALLFGRIGDRLDGIVRGASSKGMWVRAQHPTAEGKVVRDADRVAVKLLLHDPERQIRLLRFGVRLNLPSQVEDVVAGAVVTKIDADDRRRLQCYRR